LAISLRKYGCLLPNKGHWGERAAHGQDQIPGQIQNATPIGAMKAPRHCAVISGFYIPRSRQDPKIGGKANAEIISDRIAKLAPFPRDFVA
jgi:hypothetical protein